ncbi:PH domain-containing protein [Agreia pratensis]|uniref:Putative membrane protein n=1 Tax=Agreia pratensis TaxID=150121 RepID=A0A1X7JN12_9MICO|nr:PH domain-containing protein [Agreia pratensis]SMG29481.1 putative membrane protein [Agreia pratensis]
MTEPVAPPLPGGGDWLRLHPATPLLKGGIGLIAVIGFVLANVRERLVEMFVGGPDSGDLFDELNRRGHLGWAIAIVVGGLVLGVAAFYLSWRMHTYRINDEAVEVRSGILFRTHRQARLDRIQGIAITRPFIARLFGAARLELSVAGQDAKVQLAYLRGSDVDRLRHDILLLASTRRAEEGAGAPASDASGSAGIIGRRVTELLAPELDPSEAPPESVVRISPLRLAGSLFASGATIFTIAGIVALGVLAASGRELGFVFLIVPAILGSAGYFARKVTRSLRFSIAATPDGVRVGYGLLTTSNDTLPPGRIHAIEVYQPLLWRPFDWWAIRINRAGHASSGSGSQPATTMLPVGTRADVDKVLGLLLPGLASADTRHLILAGMVSSGPTPGFAVDFVPAPRRGRWLRPFSWRRTGYALAGDAVLLRKGLVWRQLVAVPAARIQSLRIEQGPLSRALDLCSLTLDTVAGPVSATLSVLDRAGSISAFDAISRAATAAGALEDGSRWANGTSFGGPGSADPHPQRPEDVR